jgi:hypothetical protein
MPNNPMAGSQRQTTRPMLEPHKRPGGVGFGYARGGGQRLIDLGLIHGARYSVAKGINNKRMTFGRVVNPDGENCIGVED